MPQPRSTAKKNAASRKKSASAASSQAKTSPRGGTRSAAARDEALRENMRSLRELLSGGIVLSAQNMQEALDNAVENGRMLRHDAEELARGLLESGRRQSQSLLSDLDNLLGESDDGAGAAVRSAAGAVRGVAGKTSDRVLREADRARRRASLPPTFPILNYDELSARQVIDRTSELSEPELRKVRDQERRGKARKTVLAAIEKQLG